MATTVNPLVLLGVTCLGFVLASCDAETRTADQVQNSKQEQLTLQGVQSVGLPAVTNFSRKRLMKDIIELLDNPQPTYTYFLDFNGHLHKFCDSMGYPLPAATQYTSPQRIAGSNEARYQGNVVVPQADPDGLYSPPTDDATWVMCLNPQTGKASVVYSEPHVVTSPFPLDVK